MEEISVAAVLLTVLLLYTVLAVYVGNHVLEYRSEWLDAPGLLNRAVRFILSLIIGYVIACFYLGWIFFKFVLAFIIGK